MSSSHKHIHFSDVNNNNNNNSRYAGQLEFFLLVQSFTARMPLLTATSAFGLGRRRWSSAQQCYLHCLSTLSLPSTAAATITCE